MKRAINPVLLKEGIKKRARGVLSRRGLVLAPELGADFSPETVETIAFVRPQTMTTVERIEAVISATEYVVAHRIPGAFVESGVWMGGSSMAAARTLARLGDTSREMYLYDTFEGIPEPGEHDGLIGHAVDINQLWHAENSGSFDKGDTPAWLDAPIDKVRANMVSTGYPAERLHLVAGYVQDTIPATAPDQVAFLRLDTDWYESTKVELEVLFPRLSPGGIMIIDDYGFTTGCRKAVDEYFATYPHPVYLHRVDVCGRLVVKPGLA